MIQSLFLLSPTGEILIERHFRGNTSRSICRYFWDRACESLGDRSGLATSAMTTSSSVGSCLSSSDSLFDTVPPVLEVPYDDYYYSDVSGGGGDGFYDGRGKVKGRDMGGPGVGGTLYLFSILRDGLSYLAACRSEVSPLLILEFLHRVADTFNDYFGTPTDENAIKENFSTVYQLLEEMVDFGWPLTTEPNALQDMIRPPTVMGKIQQVVTGSNAVVAEVLPTGTISNMPWRKAGVKHSQNEIYVDIVEEIDAIVDASGRVVSSDVSGSIQAQSHLSGVPDLLMTFADPEVIDDCSFHPCVRYARYELDRVVSFVPPDGNFELMRYRVKNAGDRVVTPPIFCTPQFSFGAERKVGGTATAGGGDSGRITISIGTKPTNSLIFPSTRVNRGLGVGVGVGVSVPVGAGAFTIEDVSVTIPFPRIVRTANLTANVGNVLYDEASRVARWVVGKLDDRKRPQLTGTLLLVSGGIGTGSGGGGSGGSLRDGEYYDRPEENPPLTLTWKIPQASVSGLSVSGLSMVGENYRPYKGVRTITKSGRFQVRCN